MPTAKYKEMGDRRLATKKLLLHPVEKECVPKKVIDIPVKCKPKTKTRNLRKVARQRPGIRETRCVRHYPVVPDHGPENPFCVPPLQRFFNKIKVQRVTHPIEPDTDVIKTITDIHPEFFKTVEEREVRPRFDFNVYIDNIRSICMFKADTGYIKDRILYIDFMISQMEKEKYKKCAALYHTMVLCFQMFLEKSFKDAVYIVNQSLGVAAKLEVVTDELEYYSSKYSRLKNYLATLADRIQLLTKYQESIYRLSPIYWRLKHDAKYFDTNLINKKLFRSETHVGDYVDIHKDTQSHVKIGGSCELYFQHPKDLMDIFENMAHQCCTSLNITCYSAAVILPGIKKEIKYLKSSKLSSEETQQVILAISEYEEKVKWQEEIEKEHETKFYRILYGIFEELLTSYDYNKLYDQLCYINKKVLGNVSDKKDSLYDLMREVEVEYMTLLIQLDDLDNLSSNDIKSLFTEIYKQDKCQMNKALHAQKVLKEWAVFEKTLTESFEKPRCKINKKKQT